MPRYGMTPFLFPDRGKLLFKNTTYAFTAGTSI